MIYYVNDHAQADGYHEVHKSTCSWLASASSKTKLGDFVNAVPAVAFSKKNCYTKSDGCYYCSKEAHTR